LPNNLLFWDGEISPSGQILYVEGGFLSARVLAK